MQRHAGKTRESREASKVRAEAAEEKPAARLQTREGKKRERGRAKDESKLRRGGRNGSINSTFLSHSTKVVLESKGVLTLYGWLPRTQTRLSPLPHWPSQTL